MTLREDREKAKTKKQEMARVFFGLCQSSFSVTIIGNLAPLLGLGNIDTAVILWSVLIGFVLSATFFYIGYSILNK